MPLADFLATAGQGTSLENIAEAFGGKSNRQRAVEDFIDKQLPAIAEEFQQTDPTSPEMPKLATRFMQTAHKAGMTTAGIKNMLDMLVRPAAARGYGQMADEMSPKAEARPEGVEGPVMQSGAFLERPGKPFDSAMAARAAQIEAQTGVKIPGEFNTLLKTPGEIRNKEISTQKTEQELEGLKRREGAIAALPDEQIEGAPRGLTTRGLMQIQPSAVTQVIPQRDMSGTAQAIKNQELAIKQSHLEALNQRSEFLNQLGTANMATAEHRLELQRLNTEIRQMELELKKQGTDTETQWAPNVLNDEATRFKVAQEAPKGATDKELKEMFAARGYDVEGNLSLVSGGIFGANKVEGITSLKRKPKTTSQRPGGAAPAGQATAPAPSSGAGPAAPKVGEVRKGYRFKGGNPADQASWEQVR